MKMPALDPHRPLGLINCRRAANDTRATPDMISAFLGVSQFILSSSSFAVASLFARSLFLTSCSSATAIPSILQIIRFHLCDCLFLPFFWVFLCSFFPLLPPLSSPNRVDIPPHLHEGITLTSSSEAGSLIIPFVILSLFGMYISAPLFLS